MYVYVYECMYYLSIYACMNVFNVYRCFVYLCICVLYACLVFERAEKALDPLEPELRNALHYHTGAGELTKAL